MNSPQAWTERKCLLCDQTFKRREGGKTQRCDACRTMQARAGTAATLIVRKAIAQGFMSPASARHCADCGGPASVYDHRDYGKPLDVDPVCRSCNARRGPAQAA